MQSYRPRAVVAPMLFDRIRFQAGTFTVDQRSNADAGRQVLRETGAMQTIKVSGPDKDSMRRELEALGFDEVSIYRDLDRIAKRISTGHGRTV